MLAILLKTSKTSPVLIQKLIKLNFAGDTGNVSNRQLGDTVTVKGGATGTVRW